MFYKLSKTDEADKLLCKGLAKKASFSAPTELSITVSIVVINSSMDSPRSFPPVSFPTYLSTVDMKFDNNNVSRFPTTVFTFVVPSFVCGESLGTRL